MPMSDTHFPSLPKEEARVESAESFSQWSQVVWQQNPAIYESLQVRPVAQITMEAITDDRPDANLNQLFERARAEAAGLGANLIFVTSVDRNEDGVLSGAEFVAYRAQYKNALLSPYQLASLPRMPVSSDLAEAHAAYTPGLASAQPALEEEGSGETRVARLSSLVSDISSLASDIVTVAVLH
jgi:hypothetical protein